ncbi:unnamed protein product [Strongylus vulgaris]|uniref:Uncharacterized protein n=1 Tax=Strongylus vulgaris TaxID=40348 RepID=A0A3P7IQA0_STRVU|nr:unnamed protein product [Strongylus vulgaris]
MFEQTTSDHSSDGSYVEMVQPVYTTPEGYAYTLPAYEAELGEEIDLIEQQGDYTGYVVPGTSAGYEVVDSNAVDRSRPLVMQQTVSSVPRIVSTAGAPDYALDHPSSSKVTPKVTSVKRPLFAVAANPGYRKTPDVQQDLSYAPTAQQSKRPKTQNPGYNL